MRKLLCFFLLLLVASAALSQRHAMEIKLKINGVDEGAEILLGNYFGDKQYVQDTAIADARGRILFKSEEEKPGGIYFIVLPDRNYFEIILDDDQRFSLETDTSHLINNMRVRNSVDNELFYEYLRFIDEKQQKIATLNKKIEGLEEDDPKIDEVRLQIKAVNKKVKSYKNSFIEKHPDRLLSKVFLATKEIDIPEAPILPDGTKDSLFAYHYFKDNYFRYFDFSDDRLLRTPVFHGKLHNYLTNLVVQMPDSIAKEADRLIEKTDGNRETFKYLVWHFTNYAERSNIMGMDAAFVYMVENYYMTNKAFWVSPEQLQRITDRAMKLKPLLLGKVAPNITVLDSLGQRHSLLNIEADYTILYIWSTDCGHCKRMTPILKDFYLENRDKGVEVFALCTETDVDEWKKALRENDVDWINVWDPVNMSNFRNLYDVYSTPILYLLDSEKKILAKRIDAEQLKGMLDRMMNEEFDLD